jgi:ribosome maturation factor RimP
LEVGQKPAFFVTQNQPANQFTSGQRNAVMKNAKAIEDKITDLVTGDLAAMGYELVRVQMTSGGRYATLQVMAERIDGKAMTVEDCVTISRAASAKLDETDPMGDRYTLEVSSPGIDRPLVRLKDFERFTGHVARIELSAPLNGKGPKRFEGSIMRVTGNAADAEIELETETGAVRVALNAIKRARLVLTDGLLNAAAGNKH